MFFTASMTASMTSTLVEFVVVSDFALGCPHWTIHYCVSLIVDLSCFTPLCSHDSLNAVQARQLYMVSGLCCTNVLCTILAEVTSYYICSPRHSNRSLSSLGAVN